MPSSFWFRIPRSVRSLVVVCIALLLSVGAHARSQAPIFPITNFYRGQVAGAPGDFNGDGRADLAYISSVGQQTAVTVLLNQGDTTPPVTVVGNPLNCTAQSIVAADMNKDGKLDVVLTCSQGYVVVLLGNGDGTFQTAAYYAVSGAGTLTIPVDFNGDGYPDVALLTNGSPKAVVILLNQGNGAPGILLNPVVYAAPTGLSLSSQIATGDFNGDGKQDIVANLSSGLAVYYGNGDGTLQTPQTTPGGGLFLAADFNHDGITDIAYVVGDPQNVNPQTFQVLLGSSSGKFTTGVNLALNTASKDSHFTSLILAGSTNNGNNVNLALVGDNTTILLGDGSGGFTFGQSYAINGFPAVAVAGSNGKTNLLFSTSDGLTLLTGNGDGTFQGLPALSVGRNGFVVADVNNDGLTDVLTINLKGNIVTALGRGNGTFSRSAEVAASAQDFLVAGDFNADGNADVLAILPGNGLGHGATVAQDSELFFYKGNGDGTFQPSAPAVDLQVIGAGNAVVGDFNGDGKLDVVLSYNNPTSYPLPGTGLVFVPGKGDGTFGVPVPFSQNPQNGSFGTIPLFVADLNNDKKLDLIWQNAVYLGNGDGTFRQIPLGLTGTPLAVGDLNGDGKIDLVMGSGGSFPTQANLYAGNGDGTFQLSPFYMPTLPQYAQIASANIGDVNADGHPDLLLQNSVINGSFNLAVSLGDGQGNFVADYNTYFTGGSNYLGTPYGFLTRLNNQAPKLPNDNALDFLTFTNSSATSLLNQINPAPAAPLPLPSKTTLAASASSVNANQQLTFTATVTGLNPTGSVSFVSGTTTLGTAALTNGTATLSTSFAAADTYAVIANYAGDVNNLSSSSSAVSVTVPQPTTTTLAASASSANLNEQVTLTATVTGATPTGSVSFVSGTTTLGTAAITGGKATLSVSFAAAGTNAVTANYAGDSRNLASVSSAVSIAVIAPDFTVSASPASLTIKAGQTASTTFTVTPVGGYGGTVKFSCGTLPSEVTCTFAPSSVTPVNGAPVASTLTVTTTAPTAMLREKNTSLPVMAFVGVFCVAFSPRRMWRFNQRFKRSCVALLLLACGLISVSGCGGSSSPKDPGTPSGTQSITVAVTDAAANTSHTLNLQITVQ